MDHAACNVVYLDRRASEERVRRESLSSWLAAKRNPEKSAPGYFNYAEPSARDVYANVDAILSVFNEVHLYRLGSSCLAKLTELTADSENNVPTIVIIDLPYDEEQRLKRLSREPRTPSPTAARRSVHGSAEPDDLYGMHFLQHISSEIQQRRLPKLVVPVVVLTGLDRDRDRERERGPALSVEMPSPGVRGSQVLTDTVRLARYLDAGAVDVFVSPISKDNVHGLAVHAYRVYKAVSREESNFLASKRRRRISWVGVDEEKPFAYLREAMVSGLMDGICNPGSFREEQADTSDIEVSSERREIIADAVGRWTFSAHDYNDDELVYCCLLMLQHALKMPEVEKWNMSESELVAFLLASRTAYNEFVLYHNFRHVADVLQALFYFLVQVGALPPYPYDGHPSPTAPKPPIATLLKPFDALTLLISAIGHDVGHPGVNNAFLVALNSPLAQLYNDRSVLESFHCAAYSQILRRCWPQAFSNVDMRKLMITSILATDMGLHFKYMADLGNLQEKLHHNNNAVDGWNLKQLDEFKDLLCGILIKCADISNVARTFDTAAKWANILTDEFSNQGAMEKELGIPTCLFGGPPVRDDLIKLGESQIGFMNIFARPLFEAATDVLPGMKFGVDEILRNKSIWSEKIEAEKERTVPQMGYLSPMTPHDGVPSPFSRSRENLADADIAQQESNSQSQALLRLAAKNLSESSSKYSSADATPQSQPVGTSPRPPSLGGTSAREKEETGREPPGPAPPGARGDPAERGGRPVKDSANAGLAAVPVIGVAGGAGWVERQGANPPPIIRSPSPKKSAAGAGGAPNPRDERPAERPTTAPSGNSRPPAVNGADMADYPLTSASSGRPQQPPSGKTGRTPPTSRTPVQSQSETNLPHQANGTLDGASSGSPPQHWKDHKRSDDSGCFEQGSDETGRSNNGNSRRHLSDESSRRRLGTWRKDRSHQGRDGAKEGGRDTYVSSVAPASSHPHGTEKHSGRKEKFLFSKLWKKIKTGGESREKEEDTSAGVGAMPAR